MDLGEKGKILHLAPVIPGYSAGFCAWQGTDPETERMLFLGDDSSIVDRVATGAEFARFSFNTGAATGVSFKSSVGSNLSGGGGKFGIEGFGVGGGSLGVAQVNYDAPVLGPLNVSSLFGNVALSSFRIQGALPDTGVNVESITFTPAGVVPEPGTLALLGTGLLPLVGMVRRRRSGR